LGGKAGNAAELNLAIKFDNDVKGVKSLNSRMTIEYSDYPVGNSEYDVNTGRVNFYLQRQKSVYIIVSTCEQLCTLSFGNARRQNFSKSFVCRWTDARLH